MFDSGRIKKLEAQNEKLLKRLESLEKEIGAEWFSYSECHHVKRKEPTMRITTPDYRPETLFLGGFSVCSVGDGRGEKRDVPLSDAIRMLADAAGIELVLDPKKCTGGEVVAKKKRKARS